MIMTNISILQVSYEDNKNFTGHDPIGNWLFLVNQGVEVNIDSV